MSKKQTEKTITINDKEYKLDDFTAEHNSSRFNLDQLIFGKEAFINALAASLEAPEEVTE